MLQPATTDFPAPDRSVGEVRVGPHRGPQHELAARLPSSFQPVLTIRGSVEEAEAAGFTRRALREIRSYVTEHHLELEGPPFSICRPLPGGRVDVEAGWPVRHAVGTSRIHSGALPITRVRTRPPTNGSRSERV
jgi:hypothetical protein